MLMQEATQEMLKAWKAVWDEYKDRLRPNRKSGSEIVRYLSEKYVLLPVHDEKALRVVTDNILNNSPLAEKLPSGDKPSPVAFFIRDIGNGKALYENQDTLFKGLRIFAGIDLISGVFHIEGSSMLWDEVCAFQGLDEKDIKNPYCVATYISCLKRFGLMDKVLGTM